MAPHFMSSPGDKFRSAKRKPESGVSEVGERLLEGEITAWWSNWGGADACRQPDGSDEEENWRLHLGSGVEF
jgi:hypothetical protein